MSRTGLLDEPTASGWLDPFLTGCYDSVAFAERAMLEVISGRY